MTKKRLSFIITLSLTATLLATTGRSATAATTPKDPCGPWALELMCQHSNDDDNNCDEFADGEICNDFFSYNTCWEPDYSLSYIECIDWGEAWENYCPYDGEDYWDDKDLQHSGYITGARLCWYSKS